MSLASLNDIACVSASVWIPKWGVWHADVTLEREATIAGDVTLKIGDATFAGTVLSGGAWRGRSLYRIVGGKGRWGKKLPRKGYANDAGVKLSTLINDAANACGESVDPATVSASRVGTHYVREADKHASHVLEVFASKNWYVGEDGVTRIGARTAATYAGGATRVSYDAAREVMVLASDKVKDILPGVTIDTLEILDVLHELREGQGLRTTVWGRGETSRRLQAFASLVSQLDPRRDFRAPAEYRVVDTSGECLDLQPVRVSAGMPDLSRVPIRPGVAGVRSTPALGSRVLVAFIEAEPSRPFVCGFEDPEGEGFTGELVEITADGMVGGEHVATVEATALLIYNTLVTLMATAGGGPLIAAVLQPLLGAAINTALGAQSVPAPPGMAAQVAAAAAQTAGFAAGVVPATTSSFFATAIAGVETKTPNVSGLFPSTGSRAVKAG